MKIIGLAVIIISALLFGNFKSNKLKRRISILKESEKLISLIDESTLLNQKSLSDIFCGMQTEAIKLKYIDAFRKNIATLNQPQAIEKAIFETDDLLTDDDKIFFSEFYKSLGKNGLKKELEKIRIFSDKLNKRIDDAEKEYAKKGQLYRKLSTLTGLLIAIFLI